MKKIFTSFLAMLVITSIVYAQDKKACLKFDGDDDKVVIAHHPTLNLGRSAFTIEAWVTASGNMVVNAVQAPIVFSKKGVGSSSQDGFLFGLSDKGQIALQMEGTNYTPGFGGWGSPGVKAIDLRDGTGHHMAWTREIHPGQEDTVNGYQDAAYVRKTRLRAGNDTIENSEDVWLGASEFNVGAFLYQFEGQIKEVRIWNYAKTESEIWSDKSKHMKGNEPGLLFYWRLNENSGTKANDCGPNGRHGTITGATWENFYYDTMDDIPLPNLCVTTGPPPTGVAEANKGINVVLYPNPIADELRLLSDQEYSFDMVTIYDMNGKEVIRKNWDGKEALNISNLEVGTYMVHITKDSAPFYKTVIVKR